MQVHGACILFFFIIFDFDFLILGTREGCPVALLILGTREGCPYDLHGRDLFTFQPSRYGTSIQSKKTPSSIDSTEGV
jgi:hypothetical protein